jgi:hypothetical protein
LPEEPAGRVVWEPQPRQALFIACPAIETFFGGSKGGGKTDGSIGDWLSHAKRYGNFARGILFRKTNPELERVLLRMKEVYPLLNAVWKEKQRSWIFPNKAILFLRFIDRDDDAQKYQGHDYSWIDFEELGNYGTPYVYYQMMSCLRSAHDVLCQMRSTGNPGGPGQGWVKRRFISRMEPNKIYTYTENMRMPITNEVKEVKTTRCFIPSNVVDNKYYRDSSYMATLNSLPDHFKRAYLYGDWNVSMGQAFSEYDESIHTCEPFLIPSYWPRFASLDWGYAHPFSLGLWAYDPCGCLYRIGEDYGCVPGKEDEGIRLAATSAGRRWVKILNAAGIDRTYADPSMWSNHGHGETIAAQVERAGMRLIPGSRDTAAGEQAVHNLLQKRLEDGRPGLVIFKNCDAWIRTVPELTADKKNIEKIDTSLEDHPYDDTRYAVLSPEVVYNRSERSKIYGGRFRHVESFGEEHDYARG